MIAVATRNNPAIYIADLAAYNAGILSGEWIDADREADEIHQDIVDLLSRSPIQNAEEYAIHDSEGFFGLKIHDFESLAKIAEYGQAIAEFGRSAAAFIDYQGEWDREAYLDAYIGEYDSEADFCYARLEETGELEAIEKVAPSAAAYIDFEAVARDWFLSDFWETKGDSGKILVFYRW
jgi:antirestriction protein